MPVSLNTKIQQLCSLGLSSHVIIGELTDLLGKLIPSYGMAWMWLDGRGEIDHIYSDHFEAYEKMALYAHHVNRLGNQNDYRRLLGTVLLETPLDYGQLFGANHDLFRKHLALNEIILPMKIQNGLMASITLDNHARAVLHVFRDRSSENYKLEDKRALGLAARHISYGLSKTKVLSELHSNSLSNIGFLQVSKSMKCIGHSDQALQMLNLMADDSSGDPFDFAHCFISMLADKISLFHNDSTSQVPNCTIENQWGRFDATAFLMQSAPECHADTELIIRIEHLVPSELLFFKKLDLVNLTARQREVCIQIAVGQPYQNIAESLGIAESTVVSHKKEIFNRLGISHRGELNNRIIYS